MGDMTKEPSMEDILSSIRRVIERDDETRAKAQAAYAGNADGDDGTLELTSDVQVAEPHAPLRTVGLQTPKQMEDAVADEEPAGHTVPVAVDAAPDAAIVSTSALDASRHALSSLEKLVDRPTVGNSPTIEDLTREALKPLLKEWLDANLPAVVDRMVAREVERITRRDL